MSFSITLTDGRTKLAPYMTIIMNLVYCHIDKFSIVNLRGVINVILVLLSQVKVIIADFPPSG